MKKIIALLLAVVMLFSLAACGGASTADNGEGKNKEDNKTENKDEKAANKDEKAEISFTEMTVVDNDECLMKITGINPDNMNGYVELQLENKSAEKDYTFSMYNAAINGVQWNPYFTSSMAAGQKADVKIKLPNDELKKNDIGDFTDIELSFRVYENNDGHTDIVAEETVHIYPYGEDKAEVFVRQPQANDNVVLDNENVTVIVTGYEDDNILGYTVNLFFVNKSDKALLMGVDDTSVNGIRIYSGNTKEVITPGKCTFSSMSWSDVTLKQHNITEVEEIEFMLLVDDRESWHIIETIMLNP